MLTITACCVIDVIVAVVARTTDGWPAHGWPNHTGTRAIALSALVPLG